MPILGAFGLAILIGAAVTLLGALVVSRLMPARQEPLPEANQQESTKRRHPPFRCPNRHSNPQAPKRRTTQLTKEKTDAAKAQKPNTAGC